MLSRFAVGAMLVLGACSSPPPVINDGGGQGGGSTGSTCDAGSSDCGAGCVELRTSNAHCGACGNACTSSQACAGGSCLATDCTGAPCLEWQVCLNESCVDRECVGVICPSGELCARGQCLPSACGAMTCGAGLVCQNGSCVDAACVGVICPAQQRCAGGSCVSLTCTDGMMNGTETGLDCGGMCAGCRFGEPCAVAGDCQSGVCTASRCGPAASCADGVKDGTEIDVDCGGGSCPPCASGHCGCLSDADCAATRCTSGCCVPASCTDGFANGAESDRDCGGDGGCARCTDGARCRGAADCSSSVCGDAGTCTGPSCIDLVRNGRETDTDCGGDGGCPLCGQGKVCTAPSDCLSRACTVMRCEALTCGDGVKNGAETDTDCGGACPACVPGRMCLVPEDCTSKVCVSGVCQAPTCTDGIRNGSEAGPDCGGACYPCGFARPVNQPIGGLAADGIVAADFNADGNLDLAIAAYSSRDVSVLLGNGNGTFQSSLQYDARAGGSEIAAGDVSGDGVLDLLVHTQPDAQGNTVAILTGNGDGTFQAAIGLAAGNFFDRSIAFADLDGDGKLDVAMGENSRIDLRFANGNTTFRSDTVFFCAGYVNSLAAADFTGDGRLDLTAQVATGSASNQIITLVQQADGGFPRVDCLPDGGVTGLVHSLASAPGAAQMRSADLNSDGKADLMASAGGLAVTAFGQGDGGFVNGPNLGSGGCTPQWMVAADVNRDSGIDIIGSCSGSAFAALGVSLGQGSAFQQPVVYAGTSGIGRGVAVGDFDKDGRLDVALVDTAATPTSRVLIFMNRF